MINLEDSKRINECINKLSNCVGRLMAIKQIFFEEKRCNDNDSFNKENLDKIINVMQSSLKEISDVHMKIVEKTFLKKEQRKEYFEK